jgi:NhaP-type Na+/H+ and K+/H+ antiporter
MKHEKLIYGITSILVIVGAIMQILHLRFGNPILVFSLVGTSIFQMWHVMLLNKKIKELEQ